MIHRALAATIVAAALVALGCGSPQGPSSTPQATSALANAHLAPSAPVFVAEATLAPVGSFEAEAAPAYSQVGLTAERASVRLLKGLITADQAQVIHDEAAHVQQLLDEARSLCNESDRTGRCRGDEGRARALLAEAREALAAIH